MIARTHVTFAGFLYLLLLTPVGISLTLLNAAVVACASVLPDIDSPSSSVGRLIPFVSRRLERSFGHRTLTHSVAGMAALALAALPLFVLNRECYLCFMAGYASHPLLDTMTITGVKLFYPFSGVRCVFPLDVNTPHRYRVRTGGRLDKALAVFFALGSVPVWFVAHQGYERFIRTTQQSIEAAVRDYNDYARTHLVFAAVSSYEMLSKEPLEGTFPVVGALDARTLLIKAPDGELHTLGKAFDAEFVAQSVLCLRGDPVRWEIRKIDLTSQVISQIGAYLDSSRESYCFGSLILAEHPSVPEDARSFASVAARGNILTLNYATIGDLNALGVDDIVVLKGILTIQSRSGGRTTDPRDVQERFVHLGLAALAGETLEILANEGDTIASGQTIVRRGGVTSHGMQMELNDEKLRVLVHRRSSEAARILREIAIAALALGIDSAAFGAELELHRSGYLSDGVLAQSELKLEKSRSRLEQLRRSAEKSEDDIAMQVRTLRVANNALRIKQTSADPRRAIRSSVAGVITRVTERLVNGKREIGFVIKTLRR